MKKKIIQLSTIMYFVCIAASCNKPNGGGTTNASTVAQVVAGNSRSFLVKVDGTAWAIGRNTDGQLSN